MTTPLESLVSGGRLVLVATHGRPVELETNRLQSSRALLVGSLAYLPGGLRRSHRGHGRRPLRTAGWVEEIGLDDVTHALGELRAGRGMKVLVSPDRR